LSANYTFNEYLIGGEMKTKKITVNCQHGNKTNDFCSVKFPSEKYPCDKKCPSFEVPRALKFKNNDNRDIDFMYRHQGSF